MKKLNKYSRGSTMTEYALLCSLIAIVCIGSIKIFQTEISGQYDYVSNALEGNDVDVEYDAGGCSGGVVIDGICVK